MALRVGSIEDVFPLADFIAEAFGAGVEVVVHDVGDPEASIVHICNGHLSGRKVGDGATDRALQLIHTGKSAQQDYVANYTGKALGSREFRCSTLFVDNREGELIGLLCVNVDVTGFDAVMGFLSAIKAGSDDTAGAVQPVELVPGAHGQAMPERPRVEELLQGDPKETVRHIARSVLDSYPIAPERFSRTERLEALSKIQDEGVFLMKGAVSIVAEEMRLSTPTLYRYLQEMKRA